MSLLSVAIYRPREKKNAHYARELTERQWKKGEEERMEEEACKHDLCQLFILDEFRVPNVESKQITVEREHFAD